MAPPNMKHADNDRKHNKIGTHIDEWSFVKILPHRNGPFQTQILASSPTRLEVGTLCHMAGRIESTVRMHGI